MQVVYSHEYIDVRDLLNKLATRNEVTYYILCEENKYSRILQGLRVAEGSDYLLLKQMYCENLYSLLKLFETLSIRGLAEGVIRTSSR